MKYFLLAQLDQSLSLSNGKLSGVSLSICHKLFIFLASSSDPLHGSAYPLTKLPKNVPVDDREEVLYLFEDIRNQKCLL